MPRLFISHSSKNDDWAIALKDWLVREGWTGPDDVFLDLDPERGIAAGQRWTDALEEAATRCEAVLFLVSEEWLASKWCSDEYQLARELYKKLFALLVDDIALDRLPGGLTAQWQIIRLKGEPAERFVTVHPLTRHQSPVHIAKAALTSLKRGLDKAGIGAETFELQADQNGPFGWRAPYRGLEALEPEDAAVFFGRGADIVRGIDTLRGLAARKTPRLLVILGASGAGKSSFLRAGLWPRLVRDDSQWLPLRAIRAGRGGAIEGSEGLLATLEDAHRRFALQTSRADLRDRLATPESFVGLLRELRQAAAKRALISEPPYPLPVLCLDQGEEVFAAGTTAETEKLLALARAAIDADAALLLVTIRSDSYGAMQGAKALAGIDQVPLSLGPVPHGEIARVIREPAEILRRKAGPTASLFDAAVIERLQQEMEGEEDALPLLAFVLQRLMREHQGVPVIGIAELDRTGGVSAAIETAAEAALDDAGIGRDRATQRDALRRLFIPRLARIDRDSKTPQRRVARQSEVTGDLASLAHALTQRRLLVAKLVAPSQDAASADTATLEVAHEALLRRWPTLAELLAEDRDALLLLDGVLSAAADWDKADAERKPDFLAHRGSRLADAQALTSRGVDWQREVAPARNYLDACAAREAAEREAKEAALAREEARLAEIAAAQKQITAEQARTARTQRRARWALALTAIAIIVGLGFGAWQYKTNTAQERALDHGRINFLAELAADAQVRGNSDVALRIATLAAKLELSLRQQGGESSSGRAALASAVSQSGWLLNLSGHNGTVHSAAFSPDGKHIVTASDDETARIWDAATGKELTVLRGHESWVLSAAFSPDGTRIVTASGDDTARIWDAATGKQLTVLRGHKSIVYSAAFSPDGARIVTGAADKTARVWDAATGQQLMVLSGDKYLVNSTAFSPDGTRIVTASSLDDTVRIWDAATGKQLLVLQPGASIYSAVFSPDGTHILTASGDDTARIWDAATGKQLMVLNGHESHVNSAAFSPDGTRIVTASDDKTTRIWDAANGTQITVLNGHEDAVNSAAFSSDGSRIVTASSDKTARVWSSDASNQVAVLRGEGSGVSAVAFSPDGTRIATAGWDNAARVWDAATAKQLMVLSGHTGQLNSAAFSSDGAHIVTASSDKTARIWDAATGKQLMVLHGHESYVYSAAFSPDGTRIVTASDDKTARIWDAATGKQLIVLRGHRAWLSSAAFSPDGTHIVTASSDNTARIWDAATGKQLMVLSGHQNVVTSAAFSPDGAHIVTASWDNTARIWDAASGKELIVLRGDENYVSSASFNSDGTRIVTASKDDTARVWDAASGSEIMALREPQLGGIFGALDGEGLNSVAFKPDGSRIVAGSEDATARLWDVHFATASAQNLMDEVCLRRLRGLTTLSRDEMRLAGYADDMPAIDVCAGNDQSAAP